MRLYSNGIWSIKGVNTKQCFDRVMPSTLSLYQVDGETLSPTSFDRVICQVMDNRIAPRRLFQIMFCLSGGVTQNIISLQQKRTKVASAPA